jgi:predicted nucleotide-binding protein (sugar kinase/HSP70/actin superfamily)
LGECTVLRDRLLNHNVEEILGELGAQVRNFFQLGAELQNIFNFGLYNEYSEKRQLRKAYPYLQVVTGGHALDSVANARRCAEAGFDGVVHLCPLGCMPEVSVKPILRQVCRDAELPLLELSFDEHTAHAGVCTRLEAFVDVMLARRKKRACR